MKPQFSIVTLLGVTAYVAVAVAGIILPMSTWNSVNFWLACGIVIWLGVEAGTSRGQRRAFAVGMTVACIGYIAIDAALEAERGNNFLDHVTRDVVADDPMPSLLLAQLFAPQAEMTILDSEWDAASRRLYRVSVANTSMIVGLFGRWPDNVAIPKSRTAGENVRLIPKRARRLLDSGDE